MAYSSMNNEKDFLQKILGNYKFFYYYKELWSLHHHCDGQDEGFHIGKASIVKIDRRERIH